MTLITDSAAASTTTSTTYQPNPPRSIFERSPAQERSAVLADLHQEVADLRRQLETQPSIEQAKGLLMGYYGIEADTAFAVLRRWSQHSNVKIRVLSSALVSASTQPSDRPYGALLALLDQLGTTTAEDLLA